MFKSYFNFDFTNIFDVDPCLFPICQASEILNTKVRQIYSQARCMLSDKFFHKSMVIIIMMMMIVINAKCTFVSNKDIAVRIRFMSIFTHVQLATLCFKIKLCCLLINVCYMNRILTTKYLWD